MIARFVLAFSLLAVSGCASRGGRSSDGAPPPTFVRTTADAPATRTIQVREGQTKQQLFRALAETLGEAGSVDVRDQNVGFVMTTWQAILVREGVPDLRYRTRIIGRYLGNDWRQLQLKVEANWRDKGDEWQIGYDMALLERVAGVMMGRVGARR
jgi:hypothetical protein